MLYQRDSQDLDDIIVRSLECKMCVSFTDEPFQAPEPLLPSFGAGNIRRTSAFFSTYTILYELFPLLIPAYYQDITMMMMFNAKERSLDEFKVLG